MVFSTALWELSTSDQAKGIGIGWQQNERAKEFLYASSPSTANTSPADLWRVLDPDRRWWGIAVVDLWPNTGHYRSSLSSGCGRSFWLVVVASLLAGALGQRGRRLLDRSVVT